MDIKILIILALLTMLIERAIMANSWYHYAQSLSNRLKICQNIIKQLEDKDYES